MLTKAHVFSTVEKLLEQFSIDQLIDKLIFTNKVETGIVQSKSGNVNTREQAKQKLSKWLKKKSRCLILLLNYAYICQHSI